MGWRSCFSASLPHKSCYDQLYFALQPNRSADDTAMTAHQHSLWNLNITKKMTRCALIFSTTHHEAQTASKTCAFFYFSTLSFSFTTQIWRKKVMSTIWILCNKMFRKINAIFLSAFLGRGKKKRWIHRSKHPR